MLITLKAKCNYGFYVEDISNWNYKVIDAIYKFLDNNKNK